MEVSKADFARMAGVSKAAISKKSKNKRLIVNSAGFIDTDNPINRMYLEKHQRAKQNKIINSFPEQTATIDTMPGALLNAHATTGAAFPEKSTNSAAPVAPARNTSTEKITESVSKYATDANRMLNMTLRELLQNYNGLDGVEKYAKILKDLMAADERAQRIQERRQLQIPKDFVISRLFGYLNQQNNRLLDLPESMVDQVIALAQTGAISAPAGSTPGTMAPLAQTDAISIEQLAQTALSDAPSLPEDTKTTNNQTETPVSLNDTRQKIVNYLRDNITRCIGGAKEAIISELKMLQAKYSETNDTQNQLQDIYEALNEN